MEVVTKRRKLTGPDSHGWSLSQLRAAGVFLTKVVARTVDQVANPDALCMAMALRDRFLLAVFENDQPRMHAILKSLSRAKIDREILNVTGLGHMLNDRSIWKMSGSYDCQLACALRQ